MHRILSTVMALALSACAAPGPQESPSAAAPQIQLVRDPELERQVTQLEIRIMERDAQIENLNARLEQALREVVATMAKLRSIATRAEAASAMAEADVALKSGGDSGRNSPELKQAAWLMQQSTEEFQRKNFGGALYLANQAKTAARLRGGSGVEQARQGEVVFAAPVSLRASMQANVRVGPGMSFPVAFVADSGSPLSGLASAGEWVRVRSDDGNEGWIFGALVGRRDDRRP